MAGVQGDSERGAIGTRHKGTLGAQIADLIRGRITRGEWQAGQELPSEAEMAELFQVSQRVVRDGLRALSNQGIITTAQGKRARVAGGRPVAVTHFFRFLLDSDAGSLDELLELRALVESRIAELAAQNASPEDVARMRVNLLEMEIAGEDANARVAADLSFHRGIAEASGNRFLTALVESLADVLEGERRMGVASPRSDVVGGARERHSTLLDAIEAGDGARASTAARDIVDFARKMHPRRS